MTPVPERGSAITIEFDDAGGATATLVGELDRISAPSIIADLGRLIDRGASPIIVDLGELSFIDLGGYRLLAEFGETCRTAGIVNLWKSPSSAMRLLVRILGPLPGMLLDDPLSQLALIDGVPAAPRPQAEAR